MRERAELLRGTIEFLRAGARRNSGAPESSAGGQRSACRIRFPVLLVDDHSLVRRGFRRMLEDETGYCRRRRSQRRRRSRASGARAASGRDCDGLRAAGNERPRTRRARSLQNSPEQAVLMLSMHSEDTLVRQALDAGARGYILKNAVDLGAGHGDPPRGGGRNCAGLPTRRAPALEGRTRSAALTPRELEISAIDRRRQIQQGNRRPPLDLSANTVAVHRANIMDALGIHKTAELVVYAIRNGLVNLP